MIPLQQTFDTIVTHLRKQNAKALGPSNHCMYCTPEGLKCAAGCLIPDELYNKEFEGQVVRMGHDNFITSLINKLGHDTGLVCELQLVHDQHEICVWESEFKYIASKFGLKYELPTG